MILKEMSMQIKYLKGQSVQKAQIARQIGVCRQTVYNHLNREEPFPKPPVIRASKLDGHKEYIQARLSQFDLPVSVLFKDLQEQGYTGGRTILQEYVRPLKAAQVLRVTQRFETKPGHQAQLDWGECGQISLGDDIHKLYVFVLILGYSRMMYAQFTTSCRLPMLLSCMKASFQFLGVPDQLLVDNMKQAVESHDVATGSVRWNRQFLDFADHFGCLPVACPPYWPRVKGKVERGVGYIKNSFLEGRTFTDLEDLNGQLRLWLDVVANCRVHGTTGQRPIDRHNEELPHLRPFSAVPFYDTRPVELRKVPSDCHITYHGVRYSIDPCAVGQTVVVRSDTDRVGSSFSVFMNDQVVATHTQHSKGSRPVTLTHHALTLKNLCAKNPRSVRNTGKTPHFLQLDAPVIIDEPFVWPTPQVEVRSLSVYESIAREGIR